MPHLSHRKALAMEAINWDDEDFATPSPLRPVTLNDDMFEFTESLRISDDENTTTAEELPPLPKGVRDVSGDRGVLLELKRKGEGQTKPSKDTQFVEMHYEGYVMASGERFDTSRDQNYPLIVQLDIPPSGNSTLIRGLEIGLREVQAGDIATVTVSAKYAYGKDGAQDIPPDADLRFEIEVLDVRSTHKKVQKVDSSKSDLSRLDDIKRERELAQQRREEEQAVKEEEKKRKAERAAAVFEKLANKNKGGKKAGKKAGKKK